MHDKTLRTIHNLQTSRRIRDRRRLFFIEGVGNFVAAVDNGATVRTIVYSPRLLSSPVAEKLVRHQRRAGVSVTKISPESFRCISRTPRASGIAAIVSQNVVSLDEINPTDGCFWLVVDTLRSPGNLGTLLRTSAAVGGGGIILPGHHIDPYAPAVVRASMNALFRQRVVRTQDKTLRKWADQHGLQIVAASPDGERAFHEQQYARPTLIALGDERSGLSPLLADLCDATVRIPMLPGADSLNLGVAGSLMMYEVVRNTGFLNGSTTTGL